MKNKENIPIALIALFNVDFGIRYISSFLRKKGFSTHIFLFNQIRYKIEFLNNDYFTPTTFKHNICLEKDLSILIGALTKLRPKLIGISVTSVTMMIAQRLTSEIKKYLDTIVVWGGVHAIIAPEECIQYADIVCIGEGEFPMWELAEGIREGQQLTGIKNLWIRSNRGIEKNELRPLIEDLDSLPFADFIEKENKFLIDNGRLVEEPPIISAYDKNTYPIMTSRGCMFNCSFCCNSVIRESYNGKGSYLRRRSVNNVIEELKIAIENRPINSIRFWDDIFIYDNNWIGEFCDRYLAEVGKTFICYVHPRLANKEMLIKLVRSGLTNVFLGIQSGSENTNKIIFSRPQSNQEILDYAKLMHELKIMSSYDFILNNPYETDLDNDATVELLLRLPRPYRVQFFSLSYFPKTVLTKKALDDEVIVTKELEQYSSKSLNNFFMFLPLSKNKNQLFWNCIIAMSANKHFSKGLVRFCKSKWFFRKYPKMLIFLARNYLHLFKILIQRRMLIQIIPDFWNKVARDKRLIYGDAKFLFQKESIYSSFFPSNSKQGRKTFCLRITNELEGDLFIILFIEIRPLFADRCTKVAKWRTKLKLKPLSQSDVVLELTFPNLYYSLNGTREQLKMTKKGRSKLEKDKIYIIKAKSAFSKKSFSIKLNYSNLGQVLCKINHA